jgi:DNA-binding CsgD family transcriptional regulator
MNNIEMMIQQINFINSENELTVFFEQVEKRYNYKWAGLIIFEPNPNQTYRIKAYGNIPEKLINFISVDKYIKRYCLSESSPITYQKLLDSKPTLKDSSFYNKLFIERHLIIPIKGLGSESACLIFDISGDAFKLDMIEKVGLFWVLLSSFIYNKYKEYIAITPNKMTKRELECIKWASDGKTSWEISQLLSISQRTVDFHLANCITKTDSINRQQAIVKCVQNGQLLM